MAAGPMETIRITKMVKAPMDRCFRLSRSIDLQRALDGMNDGPMEGPSSGLIGPNDTITWQRRTFLRVTLLKTSIDVFRPVSYYREVMVKGPYVSYEHEHHFAPFNDGTRIREEIRFTPPTGLMGRIAMRFYLRKRLVRQLEQHLAKLKQVAESEEWHAYLDGQPDFNLRPQQVTTAAVPSMQTPLAEHNRQQQAG